MRQPDLRGHDVKALTLPIGIKTFREIREGCCYVDETPYQRRLADEGKHYCLSRPRRFGKSLLPGTLMVLVRYVAH